MSLDVRLLNRTCPTCGSRLPRRISTVQVSGKPLSSIQQAICAYIWRSLEEVQRPPTQREIAAALGFAGPGTVNYHLAILEARGYLRRDIYKSRGIVLLEAGIAVAESYSRQQAPAV